MHLSLCALWWGKCNKRLSEGVLYIKLMREWCASSGLEVWLVVLEKLIDDIPDTSTLRRVGRGIYGKDALPHFLWMKITFWLLVGMLS